MLRFALVFLLLGPLPALAQACGPSSVRQTFASLMPSGAYTIVLGEFEDNPEFLRETRRHVIWRYRFEGHKAGRRGFETPFSRNVTVTVFKPTAANGMRGGRVLEEVEVLVFLAKRKRGYRLTARHCDLRQFYNPSAEDRRRVRYCMTDGC